MDEKDKSQLVCKHHFDILDKIETKMDNLTDRLFMDNGGESLQSKLNRHDIWIGRATKVGLAVAIAVFGLCIDTVQEIIKGMIN